MKLEWKRIGINETAKGSHGFTFAIRPIRHTGGNLPAFAVTKKQTAIRHGRVVRHEEVWSRDEAKKLAQDWESGVE